MLSTNTICYRGLGKFARVRFHLGDEVLCGGYLNNFPLVWLWFDLDLVSPVDLVSFLFFYNYLVNLILTLRISIYYPHFPTSTKTIIFNSNPTSRDWEIRAIFWACYFWIQWIISWMICYITSSHKYGEHLCHIIIMRQNAPQNITSHVC